MKVQTYDDVYGYEGKWIDLAGSEMPIKPRYRVMKVVLPAIPAWFVTIRLLIPSQLNFGWSVIYSLALAVCLGTWFAARLSPEVTFTGWWGTAKAEAVAWRLHRAVARTPKPVTVHPHRIRRATVPA